MFVLLDLGTNEILTIYCGDSILSSDVAQHVIEKVEERLSELNHSVPLIIHTDQGTEFTSTSWSDIQTLNTTVQLSMSKKGTPGDNAVIERMNRTIKTSSHFKTMIEQSKTKYGIQSIAEVQAFMDSFQQTHNLNHSSDRSLGVPPMTAYEYFKLASKIWPSFANLCHLLLEIN